MGFNCLVCGSAVRPGDAYRGAAVEAAAAAAAGGGSSKGGGGKGGRGKSPAAALEKGWRSSSKVDKVVELLGAIKQRNDSELAAATGSAAATAAAAAMRAAPLAARSKTDSKLLSAMRRGRSPAAAAAGGGGGGGAAAAAAGGGGSAAVRPEKAIVFSQWTSMLDLLEVPLKKGGFVFRRLDGTMTVAARERAIADFESCPEVGVGVGL
jgi:SNF2 family DNA or RNA helicase